MSIDAELIEAFSHLLNSMDEKLVVILSIIFCVFLLIKNAADNKNKRHYYDSMLKEKNSEIERLADENRRYRDIYLLKAGLSPEEMNKISAVNEVKKS